MKEEKYYIVINGLNNDRKRRFYDHKSTHWLSTKSVPKVTKEFAELVIGAYSKENVEIFKMRIMCDEDFLIEEIIE